MTVEYTTTEELLTHLYEIGIAAQNDYESFQRFVEDTLPAERGAAENQITAEQAACLEQSEATHSGTLSL